MKNIFRVESLPLKSDIDTVIMPGDFLEVNNKSLLGFEGEISLEPHADGFRQPWPLPTISRAIQGRIRIPNLSADPIQVSRSQHIADVRKVLVDPLSSGLTLPPSNVHKIENVSNFPNNSAKT